MAIVVRAVSAASSQLVKKVNVIKVVGGEGSTSKKAYAKALFVVFQHLEAIEKVARGIRAQDCVWIGWPFIVGITLHDMLIKPIDRVDASA